MTHNSVLEEKKFIFIVGTPRSGTTWLQLLLSQSPAVASTTETHLFSGYLRSLFKTWEMRKRIELGIGLHHIITDLDFVGLLRHIACEVFAKVAEKKPGATVILEKTPNHVFWGREILAVIPNAHFVHIIRDPRAVADSLMEIARSGASGSWAPSRALDAARYWIDHVSSGRSIKLLTPNYRELMYRDLHEAGGKKLFEIFQWLGVETSMSQCEQYLADCEINQLRQRQLKNIPFDIYSHPGFRIGTVDSWRQRLSRWEIMNIECVAGQLMEELGFKLMIPKWIRHVYERLNKLLTRFVLHFRRYAHTST